MVISLSSIHHSFDIELASHYGIEQALLIHHFQYWIAFNKRLNRNFHDGRTWTYQTLVEIVNHFPYWTKDQVRRYIEKLIELEILVKGNYNQSKYDKTTWYAFKNEEMFMKGEIAKPKDEFETSTGEFARQRVGEFAKPIPHTKTTHTKTQQQQKPNMPAAAVSFYSCLQSLDIPDPDKLWLMQTYNEEVIECAVKWATHPQTKIKQSLQQALKWACENTPEIPKAQKDIIENNRNYISGLIDKNISNEYYYLDNSPTAALIIPKHSGETIEIKFDEKGFKDQLLNALRKKGFLINGK